MPDLLSAAIASVLAQTSRDWEIVVVDDCSDSRPHVDSHRLVRLPRQIGYAGALAAAVAASHGETLVILDADDILEPTAVASVAAALCGPVGCVYSDHLVCDWRLRPLGRRSARPWRGDMLTQDVSHLIAFTRTAYLKSVGFDRSVRSAVDRDIVYKLEEVTELAHIPEVLYHYRRSLRGITAQTVSAQTGLTATGTVQAAAVRRRLTLGLDHLLCGHRLHS